MVKTISNNIYFMKNSKFVPLYETIYNRYKQGSGFLEGDVVKLKDGYKSAEGYKQLPDTIKQRLEDIAKSGLNMRLGRLHTPDSQYGSFGYLNLPATHADLYQEMSPGNFGNLVTIPLDLVEAIDTGVNLPPVAAANKGDSKNTTYQKPTEKTTRKNPATDEQTKVGEEQTHVKKGDYDLPKKNTNKLPGANSYNDEKPSKFKALPKNQTKPKTLKENVETLENLYLRILTEDTAVSAPDVAEAKDKLLLGRKGVQQHMVKPECWNEEAGTAIDECWNEDGSLKDECWSNKAMTEDEQMDLPYPPEPKGPEATQSEIKFSFNLPPPEEMEKMSDEQVLQAFHRLGKTLDNMEPTQKMSKFATIVGDYVKNVSPGLLQRIKDLSHRNKANRAD